MDRHASYYSWPTLIGFCLVLTITVQRVTSDSSSDKIQRTTSTTGEAPYGSLQDENHLIHLLKLCNKKPKGYQSEEVFKVPSPDDKKKNGGRQKRGHIKLPRCLKQHIKGKDDVTCRHMKNNLWHRILTKEFQEANLQLSKEETESKQSLYIQTICSSWNKLTDFNGKATSYPFSPEPNYIKRMIQTPFTENIHENKYDPRKPPQPSTALVRSKRYTSKDRTELIDRDSYGYRQVSHSDYGALDVLPFFLTLAALGYVAYQRSQSSSTSTSTNSELIENGAIMFGDISNSASSSNSFDISIEDNGR